MKPAPVIYVDRPHNRLVFAGKAATAEYWDGLWDTIKDSQDLVKRGGTDPLIRQTTQKYLPPKSTIRVLEGGCGIGHHVAGLHQLGYDSHGIDYAERTVKKINEVFPELKVIQGDVRALPYAGNSFDGYWSLGVIEHFFEGFESISSEMQRVLKPGGYLFLTFPYLSPLRKWKMRRGLYPAFDPKNFNQEHFYQFVLDAPDVIKHFKDKGFKLIAKKPINGVKGLKEEVAAVRPFLQYLTDSSAFPIRVFKVLFSTLLEPFSGHTVLLVLQKNKN